LAGILILVVLIRPCGINARAYFAIIHSRTNRFDLSVVEWFLACKPFRCPWRQFPDVVLHSPESMVKHHSAYALAKSGDLDAAYDLVEDTLVEDALRQIQLIVGDKRPYLVSAHALERSGVNAIPEALADEIGERLCLPVDSSIVQTNIVGHTGASGFARLARQALFNGSVEEGADYFLVDDFIGQGGTLANLRGYLEHMEARVLGATSLTGKPYSAKNCSRNAATNWFTE
jgi:hypothetical protein